MINSLRKETILPKNCSLQRENLFLKSKGGLFLETKKTHHLACGSIRLRKASLRSPLPGRKVFYQEAARRAAQDDPGEGRPNGKKNEKHERTLELRERPPASGGEGSAS